MSQSSSHFVLNMSTVLLEGRECSSTSRLGRTSDSAMLMTQSWFDVTVFTTYSRTTNTREHRQCHSISSVPCIAQHTHLQSKLLNLAGAVNSQQREEELEVSDALRLRACGTHITSRITIISVITNQPLIIWCSHSTWVVLDDVAESFESHLGPAQPLSVLLRLHFIGLSHGEESVQVLRLRAHVVQETRGQRFRILARERRTHYSVSKTWTQNITVTV